MIRRVSLGPQTVQVAIPAARYMRLARQIGQNLDMNADLATDVRATSIGHGFV